MLIAFSVMNLGMDVHKDEHIHTLASIEGAEEHDTLK